MEIKERESTIDLIKIVACILVVGVHTLKNDLGVMNHLISLLTVIAIPLFFMVNGYLLFLKKEMTYKYVFNKICNILKVCFAWEVLHAIAYFIYYHQLRNFIESFLMDFFQKGLFFHFWFMGALIIIYLITPFIYNLESNNPTAFLKFLIGCGICCLLIQIMQMFSGELLQLRVIQTLRIWIWLFYFMLGGWFCRNKDKFGGLRGIKRDSILLFMLVLVVWEYFMGMKCFRINYMSEAYYGALVVMLAVFGMFVYLYTVHLSKNGKYIVGILAQTTMGVYVMHPFVLAVIKKFLPIVVENSICNLGYWLGTFVICAIGTLIISKIPVLNRLIKL